MRTLKYRTALFLAIFLFFLAGCAEASDKKSEKSALALDCESFKDSHDKAACYGGQSKEAKANAEKARREATASEPESMKKARKEIEKIERNQEKARKEMYETHKRSQIMGCSGETVWVHPKAARNVKGFTHSRMNIVNRSGVTVYITQTHGPLAGEVVVRGLLNGCSMSLSQGFDHNGNNIVAYKAFGSGLLGSGGTSVSQQVYMYTCNSPNCNQFSADWEIYLH